MYIFLLAVLIQWFISCLASDNELIIANIRLRIVSQIEIIKGKLARHMDTTSDELWVASAHKNLGLLLQTQGMQYKGLGEEPFLLDALANYDLALTLDKNRTVSMSVQVLFLKATVLKVLGRGEASLEAFGRLVALQLSNHELSVVLFHRASTLSMLGCDREAADSIRESLILLPCKTDRYYHFVRAVQSAGLRTKVQWLVILEEIQLKLKVCRDIQGVEVSVNAQAHSSAKYPPHSNVVHRIYDESATEQGHNPPNSEVYYALYVAAEGAERTTLAWWYLEKANTLQRNLNSAKINAALTTQQSKHIIHSITPDFLNSMAYMAGAGSQVPIFIVGFLRSGGTLLEQLLTAHSQISTVGETSVFNANLTVFRRNLVNSVDIGSIAAKHEHRHNVLKHYGDEVVEEMRILAAQNRRRSSGGGGGVSNANDRAEYIVDRMVLNYRNIGLIHKIYPRAVILHVLRDPMDTLLSCYQNKFDQAGLEWTTSIDDLALQYSLYLELMQHFRSVLPGRVVDIRYEDLVHSPERCIRSIVQDRLHLQWDPLVQAAVQEARKRNKKSQVGSWTRYYRQLEPMRNALQKYLPDLKQINALPYNDTMNWDLNPMFDYSLRQLDEVYETNFDTTRIRRE